MLKRIGSVGNSPDWLARLAQPVFMLAMNYPDGK